MIKKRLVKSCCHGSKTYVYDLDKPVMRTHPPLFSEAGYKAPQHFIKSGIFYVENNCLSASAPFGQKKLQVKCNCVTCPNLLSIFENDLERIVNQG